MLRWVAGQTDYGWTLCKHEVRSLPCSGLHFPRGPHAGRRCGASLFACHQSGGQSRRAPINCTVQATAVFMEIITALPSPSPQPPGRGRDISCCHCPRIRQSIRRGGRSTAGRKGVSVWEVSAGDERPPLRRRCDAGLPAGKSFHFIWMSRFSVYAVSEQCPNIARLSQCFIDW